MNNESVINIHKETQRIAYFDALRLICIFGVVMLHVSDDGIVASIGSQEWNSALCSSRLYDEQDDWGGAYLF